MRPTEREPGAVWRLLSAWAAQEQQRDPFHRRVTQGVMAEMFGVSSQTVSTWKLCQARMPMDSQLRVLKATELSLDDLTAALAEDEPRIAEYVAARRAEDEVMGNAEHPAATNEADDRPPLLAVASGDEGDEALAREATERARKARQEQLEAIAEMKRKKGDE